MGGVQVCSNIFMILRLGGELRDKISVIFIISIFSRRLVVNFQTLKMFYDFFICFENYDYLQKKLVLQTF